MAARRPIIGITADIIPHNGTDRAASPRTYDQAVRRAGGLPVLLPPLSTGYARAVEYLSIIDGLVLTGGDDPRTEPFGEPTDPRVTPVHDDRQASESALLDGILRSSPAMPVLGVCLGMQMMALHAGGRLDQFMPDTVPSAERHWDREHVILTEGRGPLVSDGTIFSRHKQVVTDPGSLRVAARSDDGLIEAVCDDRKPFYLGVQWHPERTAFDPLGDAVFRALIAAAQQNARESSIPSDR